MFRFLVFAAILGAASAADAGGCAAEEEGDGVGLLQTAGRGAAQKALVKGGDTDNGGWVAKEAKCGLVQQECGDACCGMMDTCKDGKCEGFMGGESKISEKVAECPLTYTDYGERGCCPIGKILGPPETCVPKKCEDVLKYDCGGLQGSPDCTEGDTGGKSLEDLGFYGTTTFNGKTVQPNVTRTCTLDGKTCKEWDLSLGSITSNGTSSDCE